MFWLETFTEEGEYCLVKRCRIRQLLGNLPSPSSLLIFHFPGLKFIEVFILNTYLLLEIRLDELESFPSGLENDVFEFWDCRDHVQCIEELPPSDWSHKITNIFWGGLLLQQGGCSRYGQLSTLYYSQRTSLIVFYLLQLQRVLFELVVWPNCPCIEGRSCSAGKNWSHYSARWVPFPGKPSRPCKTELLKAWQFSRNSYLQRCYNNDNTM